MDFCHISHISGPILTKFRYTYIFTLAIILWCQSGFSLKVKVQIEIFKCTGIMAKTSSILMYKVLLYFVIVTLQLATEDITHWETQIIRPHPFCIICSTILPIYLFHVISKPLQLLGVTLGMLKHTPACI